MATLRVRVVTMSGWPWRQRRKQGPGMSGEPLSDDGAVTFRPDNRCNLVEGQALN